MDAPEPRPSRPATLADVHRLAAAMPGSEPYRTDERIVSYQVRGKSFVFFRTPRPDALDPHTGERLADVMVIWVDDEVTKLALVGDESTPFFTTDHFDGHTSVLVQASRLHEVEVAELAEIIEDAWLSRAPKRMAAAWLAEHP